jgi:hypothetical protein
MDPFLENTWSDVHASLTTYSRNQIQHQLPADLRARVEEHVSVELDDELLTRFRPDTHVSERDSDFGANLLREPPTALATVEAAEPTIVVIEDEPPTARSISIVDRDGGRVVTSIEFLSPHNKLTQRDRGQFRRKQELMLAAGVNLVEIDLVRQGGWVVSVREPLTRQSWSYPYRVCVVRAEFSSRAECYDVPLRERLPVIRIPLRPADRDVTLDLQSLIDQAWTDGGYDRTNYDREPMPPFEPDDAAWIRECIERARLQSVRSNS